MVEKVSPGIKAEACGNVLTFLSFFHYFSPFFFCSSFLYTAILIGLREGELGQGEICLGNFNVYM